ncbi:nuclear transcription factor [Histoplasma ohiense]|nr:nuclear transcription factor [Histoplasma ohiense (nom. inval.)]
MAMTTRDNGAVQDATYLTTFCHRRIAVGVRRRRIRDPCLDCRPIPVGRRAPRPGKGAPTPAILYVMQALVRPARPWAQRSFVFVDAMSRQRDVLTPTTRMGGVAGSHAASYCPVLSISVLVLVMKAFAAPVRRLLRQNVTVESLRRK